LYCKFWSLEFYWTLSCFFENTVLRENIFFEHKSEWVLVFWKCNSCSETKYIRKIEAEALRLRFGRQSAWGVYYTI
jgi:hypothetical protein